MTRALVLLAAWVTGILACAPGRAQAPAGAPEPRGPEPRLSNIRPLTAGGENAEAYFSPDGTRLVFQSTRDGLACDQVFVMDVDGGNLRRVGPGGGRKTCAYFLPDGERILFASTHAAADTCPAPPDRSQGYVWAIHPEYDLWTCRLDGSDLTRLTDTPGYDAEATVSPDGRRIVWTSVRDGDLELYSMNLDGSDVRRLTDRPGYDGGAFYSPDSKRIVWRAFHPPPGDLAGFAEYVRLLHRGLVKPGRMDIWVMDADGSNKRQVTQLGGASFAPYFTPDGTAILFASNHEDPQGRSFDLYLVPVEGGPLEKVTDCPPFNGFPMFSPDGTKLVFASNRGAKTRGETNLFLADWKPGPVKPAAAPAPR